jgi:hypothetical protein
MATGLPFFQPDSHLSDEGVALYVDALKLQRTKELPEEVRDHVSQCQACRKEVTGLFSILTEENYGAMGPHPFFDRRGETTAKKTEWIYRVAALVAVGVGISLIAYFISSERGEITPALRDASPGVMNSSDTTAEDTSSGREVLPSARGTYADNFAELAEYEGLVAAETRSTAIDEVSPKSGIDVNQPVVFDWKSEGKGPLLLSVLTNRDSLVHRIRIATLPYVFRNSLTPGLYYWKVESGEELVFVGKFFVR